MKWSGSSSSSNLRGYELKAPAMVPAEAELNDKELVASAKYRCFIAMHSPARKFSFQRVPWSVMFIYEAAYRSVRVAGIVITLLRHFLWIRHGDGEDRANFRYLLLPNNYRETLRKPCIIVLMIIRWFNHGRCDFARHNSFALYVFFSQLRRMFFSFRSEQWMRKSPRKFIISYLKSSSLYSILE